jgi:hypothetical protein
MLNAKIRDNSWLPFSKLVSDGVSFLYPARTH